MHKGSAFNSVVAAPERAHLAKLLTSKRHKTITKPTKQMDTLPLCRQFSATYTVLSLLSRSTTGRREPHITLSPGKKKCQGRSRTGPAPIHASNPVSAPCCINSKREEMLPSVSAQGGPWWRHRKAMRNRHWVCKVFSSPERGGKCQQGSSPPQSHAIVLSPLNLSRRVPPCTLSSSLSSTITHPTSLCSPVHEPSSSHSCPHDNILFWVWTISLVNWAAFQSRHGRHTQNLYPLSTFI